MNNELPLGWTETLLNEVALWGSGGTPSRSNLSFFTGTIPWIKTGELGSKYIFNSEECISSKALENSSAKLFPVGSVCIAMYGATIGKLSILSIEAATNQACAVAQPISECLYNEFLYYFLMSEKENFINAGKGGAQPNISQSILKNWPIKLPPLNEQKRIVAKIEELFSELDKGSENLLKAQELLKTYQQSILDNAVTGELLVSLGLLTTPFDNSYKTELSKVVSEYGQGWSPKCLNEPSTNENDWAVIKTTAIQNNEFLQNENKLLPTHLKPKFHLEIVPGDILITRAGPRNRVGIACLVRTCRKHLILCDKAYRIRANKKFLMPEYLEMLLNSPYVVDSLEGLKTGINDSGVNLTQERFLSLKLIIPPLDLQQLTLQKLQEAMSTSIHLSRQVSIALEKIQITRQSILKKAFSGELVPQDPNDEPAKVFLERIKSELSNHYIQQTKLKKKQKVSI